MINIQSYELTLHIFQYNFLKMNLIKKIIITLYGDLCGINEVRKICKICDIIFNGIFNSF